MRLPFHLVVLRGLKLILVRHGGADGAAGLLSTAGCTGLVKSGELDGFNSLRAIMTLEFDLDTLGVFQVVNDDLTGLLSTHADGMAVRTE